MNRSLPALLLAVALAAGPARAQSVPSSALPPSGYTLQAGRSVAIPAVEFLALNWVVRGFGRYVLDAEYSRVTPLTVERNLTGGFVLDTDDVWINFLGHPYQGSLAFNAARSSGLTFWEALPVTALSSLHWEIAGEAEAPSLNDLVITSTSGAVLGEALHRITGLLWDGRDGPGFRPLLLGALLDPMGAFNRAAFGERRSRASLPELPPHVLNLSLGLQRAQGGGLARHLTQAVAGVDLLYGLPARGVPDVSEPLSLFRLRGELGGHGPLFGALRLEGLLAGSAVERGEAMGVWGLFSVHEFQTGVNFRSVGAGVGPGALLTLRLGEHANVRLWGLATWTTMGAAGTLEQVDDTHRPGALGPAYAMGSGGAAQGEVALTAPGYGGVRLWAESALLFPATLHPGTTVQHLGAAGHVMVGGGHGFGVELRADSLQVRGGPERPWGTRARVFWRYRLDNT